MKYRQKQLDELQRVSEEEYSALDKFPITLVLDNVRSMQNIGAIFRSADGFAIEEIILLGITPSPPHREIHKTALGAENTVRWRKMDGWEDYLQMIPSGTTIAAVEQTYHSTLLRNFEWDGKPIVLVLGNEVNGVSEKILGDADLSLEIKQYGTKHSLNIATTAGIVLFHLVSSLH